jgi:tetratricopeptide (TPR) repeat protein
MKPLKIGYQADVLQETNVTGLEYTYSMRRFLLKAWFVIQILLTLSFADSQRFMLFPFTDEHPEIFNNWARYAITELCFAKINSVQSVDIWDPRVLFKIDSSAYLMNNDSILIQHQKRWKWDIAIGGSFQIQNDTIFVHAKVFRATGEQPNAKMEHLFTYPVEHIENLANLIVYKALSTTKVSLTKEDSVLIERKMFNSLDAFKTCAQGLGFEMHGLFDAAVTAYSRAVELDPECAYALVNLSDLYERNGNSDAAMNGFSRVADCRYKDEFTIARTANFMVDNLVPSQAVRYVDNMRSELEKTSLGKLAIGKSYIVQGEYQRGFATLTQALAMGQSDLEIQFSLGSAYLLAGEYKKAIDVFNELIKYSPDNLRYYSSLGAAYRNSGRLMESSMILESASKIDPMNTTILIDLAHTYYDLKWFERARQLLQKVIDLDPELDIAYVNLGVVYWFEGRKVEAQKSFERAALVPVSKRASWNNLGNIFSIEGNNRKAIRAYKKADKSGTKNVVVQHNLAMAYIKAGKFNKAIERYNELLRLAPERFDIRLQVAQLTEKAGRYSEAETHYRKMLEIYPYHREAIYKYVGVLERNKRIKEAIKPVELYLENFPTDKDMMVLLCDVYYKMGWYEVAIMKYNFIIRDFPDAGDGYVGVAKCMYDMIKQKNATNYDDAIYALKRASEHAPKNYLPDMLAGDIYFEYKNYNDLALEHYKTAMSRTTDEKIKKLIKSKIDKVR